MMNWTLLISSSPNVVVKVPSSVHGHSSHAFERWFRARWKRGWKCVWIVCILLWRVLVWLFVSCRFSSPLFFFSFFFALVFAKSPLGWTRRDVNHWITRDIQLWLRQKFKLTLTSGYYKIQVISNIQIRSNCFSNLKKSNAQLKMAFISPIAKALTKAEVWERKKRKYCQRTKRTPVNHPFAAGFFWILIIG